MDQQLRLWASDPEPVGSKCQSLRASVHEDGNASPDWCSDGVFVRGVTGPMGEIDGFDSVAPSVNGRAICY